MFKYVVKIWDRENLDPGPARVKEFLDEKKAEEWANKMDGYFTDTLVEQIVKPIWEK